MSTPRLLIRVAPALALIVMLALANTATGQGTVLFDNGVSGLVDARVLCYSGRFPDTNYIAQLYGGPAGSTISSLAPLFPITTFKPASSVDGGYVNPVIVSVPGVPPGGRATIMMRVLLGNSVETAWAVGALNPVTVTLGGGSFPPAVLIGLTGVTDCIPETTTDSMFLLLGITVLLFRWRTLGRLPKNGNGAAIREESEVIRFSRADDQTFVVDVVCDA